MGTSEADADLCSDAALVLRLRRREPRAFDVLYDLHRERIWRFLARLARNTARAEDLFQETWTAAARNAHRLREDTRLLPWLFTIARNKHRNALRTLAFERRTHEAVRAESGAVAVATDLGARVEARARAKTLSACFERLTDAHREVLVLAMEGLDSSEIATILDAREDAVRKRLSRARTELQELMNRATTGGTTP